MPPPPPPPPGPPPPPAAGPPQLARHEAQERNVLLQSIRQGAKLKKTETNDRSAPDIGGKGGNRQGPGPGGPVGNGGSEVRMNGGPPNLAGLFAGGMPKLKPTGRGRVNASSQNSKPQLIINSGPSPPNTAPSPQKSESNSGKWNSSDVKNRGPPPQPPPSHQKPNFTMGSTESLSSTSLAGQPHMGHSRKGSAPPLPTKPPVGSYGKPNLAPKPPVSAKPQPPSLPSRPPSISRAQSLRVPRSPGGDLKGGVSFPSQEHLASTGPPPRTSTLPANLNQVGTHHNKAPPPPPPNPPAAHRMAPAPPFQGTRSPGPGTLRPPNTRPPPPPHRTGPAPQVPPPPPPQQAPPPPPHRTSPAPPPPSQMRSVIAPPPAPTGAPPPPPLRNSSMRNGNAPGLPSNYASIASFETRFAHKFRGPQEFPPPDRFRGLTKQYPSKSASKRQPAPQPPPLQLQLENRMYMNNTSNC